MRKHFLFILSLFLLIVSCKKEDDLSDQQNDPFTLELKTTKDVNNRIISSLGETGEFKWDYFNLDELWVTHKLSNNISTFYWDHESKDNKEKDEIIKSILANSNSKLDKRDIILEVEDRIKSITLKVETKEAFEKLYDLAEVVSIEPYYSMFTEEELKSVAEKFNISEDINIKDAKENSNKNSNVYFNNYGLANTSFYNHDIPLAWENGMSGEGVGIAIIDNGIDNSNDPWFAQSGNLNGANGTNRSLTKYGKYDPYPSWMWWLPSNDGLYKKWYDLSGSHGSSMLKHIAAPLGSETGVAFRANVTSLRSTSFFGLFTPQSLKGVEKSFLQVSNSNSIKVISMSQGTLFHNEGIYRAMKLCVNKSDDSEEKLIFCAGGTFPNAQILNYLGYATFGQINRSTTLWPARTNLAVSVTGIKQINNNDIYSAEWCDQCFGEGDFVLEFIEGGSSSVATATTAGMAALIWGQDLSLTRQEVYNKMKLASDSPTNSLGVFGYGRVKMNSFIENDIPPTVVAIRGSNNKYVDSGNGQYNMKCSNSSANSWERFTIVELANGKIALRGNNGKYVSSENGTRKMRCNREIIGSWEQFTVVQLANGKIALRGNNGKYVSSENGAPYMRCNRSAIGSWEKFFMVSI